MQYSSKNVQATTISSGCKNQNINTISYIDKTLKNFREQLKIRLDTNRTLKEFSKQKFQLLN